MDPEHRFWDIEWALQEGESHWSLDLSYLQLSWLEKNETTFIIVLLESYVRKKW